MASRKFTSSTTHTELNDFTLEGVGQLTQQPWSETFRCLPNAPGTALDDLARSVGTDTKGQAVYNQVSLLRFFRAVMHPDDVDRFDELVSDKDRCVTIEALGDVLFWLGEVYTDRPTVPSSSSSPGASNGGPTSAVAAS